MINDTQKKYHDDRKKIKVSQIMIFFPGDRRLWSNDCEGLPFWPISESPLSNNYKTKNRTNTKHVAIISPSSK